MDRSLINPNQCRSYGISIYDDPTYGHLFLGKDMGEYFIPMGMKIKTCTFTTLCPTYEGFQQCHHFILSNENHWDPSTNISNISVME